jgi:Uma2 family endonuclease
MEEDAISPKRRRGMSTAQVPTALGPELAGTLMGPEEFDAVTESTEGFIYELIHGVLVVTPPPLEGERGPNDELGFLLRLYQFQNPDTANLDDTLPEQLVRTQTNRRRADRVIWAGLKRQPDPRVDVPTMVVEFVSAGKRNRRRDFLEKRDEYLAIGVTEYWVVDRFRRQMTIYRLGQPEILVAENEVYRPDLLPGFELSLAHILAVADRWEKKN